MIKNTAFIILYSLFFYGCKHNPNQVKVIQSKDLLVQKKVVQRNQVLLDTLFYENGKTHIDTVKYSINPAEVTQLPFGYDFKNDLRKAKSFYSSLIYKHNERIIKGDRILEAEEKTTVYKLPEISKITYISLSWVDTDRCSDGKEFINFLKFDRYRYRLPDIDGYQCYYWSDDDQYKKFSPAISKNCEWCILHYSFGYFILYDPKTKYAKVFAIYFNARRDGTDENRYFYVDRNYRIYLGETGIDNDEPSLPLTNASVGDKKIITISKNGEIIINKIN